MFNIKRLNRFPFQITPELFVLGGYYCNIYLIRGKYKSALIEVGVSSISKNLIEQLDFLQIEPDFLILTHPDSDHVTGLKYLHFRFPKAKLILAKEAYEILKNKENLKLINKEDLFMRKQFLKMGINAVYSFAISLDEIENYLLVENSISIDLGNLCIECFIVEGHSKGNLIVKFKGNKIIIVSDSLGVNHGKKNIPLFFTDFIKYLDTINKIISFKPDIIGPSHNRPYFHKNAIRMANRARESTLKMYNMICQSNKDHNELIKEVYNNIRFGGLKILFREEIINECAKMLVNQVKKLNSNTF